ncbi:hypothetical protein RRF68_03290 [Tenacibaculum sp. HL-MS23]|uniref:hypothetical protein n=1 Tax=Tenacibaculum sp. HL-MS23 TaxID=3077734 RepID=UPI0028FC1FB5|nr:hypothetical protein [Tenacibaculum sp. HL-MS23]WNW02464.1 hypothetical protein RRF68_03290 [Tenacibaculum sp. HL-MS23]
MLRFKKHIALLSLFVLLIPSVIQLAHTLENHEHAVCTSINDHHFHEKELDCSLLHYQLQVFSYTTASNYAVIPQHFYKTTYNEQPQVISVVYVDKKLTRGPPYFTA